MKQELELKQKEEQKKQELELKQKEEQKKQELELKQKEEQEKGERELKQAVSSIQAAPDHFLTFQDGHKSLFIIFSHKSYFWDARWNIFTKQSIKQS